MLMTGNVEKGTPKMQTLKAKTVIKLNILHHTTEDDDYNYAWKTILTPHPTYIPQVAQVKTSHETKQVV